MTHFRTDVIGSLMRPPDVLAAHAAFKAGTMPESELRGIEDRAILDALERQRALGLEVVTDGEMRRDAWMTEFSDAVDGFAEDYPVVQEKRPDGTVVNVERHTKVAVGKLQQRRRLTAYEVPFLRQHAGAQRYKITLPSPNVFGWGSYQPGAAYTTRDELHADAVEIIRREMQAATMPSRSSYSTSSTSIGSCWSTTPTAPAVSSHYAFCRKTKWSF